MGRLSIAALVVLISATAYAETYRDPKLADGKDQKNGTEAEKGFTSEAIQRGWAFGYDPKNNKQEQQEVVSIPKTKRDIAIILEESLAVQKEQLKEQRKIRAILEEQFDPKPKTIKKEDGTECVANSSADCFDFPLIAEAKRVPVLGNFLKNPYDHNGAGEYKRWLATYENHLFDIGKAVQYDSAENGSNTFKTDFKRDGYDSPEGYFYGAKEKHNSRLINAFGQKGLALKIFLGKTKDLDLYSMDQIAMFIKNHPSLPIELLFLDQSGAEVFRAHARQMDFVGKAFSQSNVIKRVAGAGEFPSTLQSTPAYMASYGIAKQAKTRIISSGKMQSNKLANSIVEWLIFEKIIDPAQISDSRVWQDVGDYGAEYIKKTYHIQVEGKSK